MPLTYIAIPGGLWIPRPVTWFAGAPGFTSGVSQVDNTTAQHYILQCPKAGTLKGFGCSINSVATPNTIRAGFQNVSLSTGVGDGTFDEFVDIASGSLPTGWFDTSTIGPITDDGTSGGVKRTVARGDLIAAVLKGVSNPVEFQCKFIDPNNDGSSLTLFPYAKETRINGVNFPA